MPLLAAGVGAAVVAVVVLAVVLSGTSSPTPRAGAPKRQTPTVARAPVDPHSLNDRGFSLMRQGRYLDALPLLERAVQRLRGDGPADRYEGFANYNLGYTLLQLGRCADARPYLRTAQQLEPDRSEVGSALASVEQCLAPTPSEEPEHGNGKGRGKHKGHD